jgi:hypothetical protein
MHILTNEQWREFFLACSELLLPGEWTPVPVREGSWCRFTTFDRLQTDAGYWGHGLPRSEDIGLEWINDGGVWGQPFRFCDLAHVIIPRRIFWETQGPGPYECGEVSQELEPLSDALAQKGIQHRLSDLVLEIKFY